MWESPDLEEGEIPDEEFEVLQEKDGPVVVSESRGPPKSSTKKSQVIREEITDDIVSEVRKVLQGSKSKNRRVVEAALQVASHFLRTISKFKISDCPANTIVGIRKYTKQIQRYSKRIRRGTKRQCRVCCKSAPAVSFQKQPQNNNNNASRKMVEGEEDIQIIDVVNVKGFSREKSLKTTSASVAKSSSSNKSSSPLPTTAAERSNAPSPDNIDHQESASTIPPISAVAPVKSLPRLPATSPVTKISSMNSKSPCSMSMKPATRNSSKTKKLNNLPVPCSASRKPKHRNVSYYLSAPPIHPVKSSTKTPDYSPKRSQVSFTFKRKSQLPKNLNLSPVAAFKSPLAQVNLPPCTSKTAELEARGQGNLLSVSQISKSSPRLFMKPIQSLLNSVEVHEDTLPESPEIPVSPPRMTTSEWRLLNNPLPAPLHLQEKESSFNDTFNNNTNDGYDCPIFGKPLP